MGNGGPRNRGLNYMARGTKASICGCGSTKEISAKRCRSCHLVWRSESAKSKTDQRCPKCDHVKLLEYFPVDHRRPAGRHGTCRSCQNSHARSLGHIAQRKYRLKTAYGLTLIDYDALFERQRGLCAGCRDPIEKHHRNTHVDHDHATGVVRGLLCKYCNTTLGHALDSVPRLVGLAGYLERGGSSADN